jgi:signal transduction histidine kinase
MANDRRWWERLRADTLLVDTLVAIALLVLTVVQIGLGEPPGGSRGAALLFAPAVTLPLAWRRRVPLAALVVIAAAVVAQSLVAAPPVSFGTFLALMLAVYSVAAHCGRREALAGAAIGAVAAGVQGLREPGEASAFEVVYGVVYFGGAWVLGRALRRRRLATVELQGRAARLEREREERARAAVAEERGRIARELHDVIAHSMSVIVVQAGAAEQVLERDPARARGALRSIRRAGNDALEEMRRLLGILRHEDEELTLAPQPSIARLDELLGQARAGGLPVELVVDGQPRQLAPGVELAAYRIVQEALTNSRKHAGAAHARVIVRYAPDALELDVVDNGRPSQPGEGTGHGLVGMRERAALYGGVLEAGARPEGGFAVHARLPLDPSRP